MTIRQLIEARIEAECRFREVAGAADLPNVLKGRATTPGCYIYRASVRAGNNGLVNAVSQRIEETYAVVIVSRNVRDPRHGDSADENEALCAQVSAALLGWQPDETTEPMEYAGGRLVSLLNGAYYWQEHYRTARHRRAV